MPENYNSDAYSLFLCAVTEMEAASAYKKRKLYSELVQAIQKSANCLTAALLAAKGIVVSKDEMNADLLNSAIDRHSDEDDAVYRAIHEVLDFDTESTIDELSVSKIKLTFNRYGDAIVRSRKILAHELKYKEQQKRRVKHQFFTRAGLIQIFYILIPLLILITLPIAVYHHLKPVSNFNVGGQIFWKTNGKLPFTSQQSHRFTVKVDNQFREYTIDLGEPVDIFLLRLDPVNKKYLTDINLEWIRLVNEEGILLYESSGDNFNLWSCNNCEKLPATEENIFSIRPLNDDLHLISTRVNTDRVKSIIIRMRAASKKTFWEWVLAIDKNFERSPPNQQKP